MKRASVKRASVKRASVKRAGREVLIWGSLLLAACASGPAAVPAATEDDPLVRLEARLDREGERYDARWKLSQAYLEALEREHLPGSSKRHYVRKALAHAEAGVRLNPARVEAQYYRAVALGRNLELSSLPSRSQISALEVAALRARERDPGFRCAGPLRFLALLYSKAPPPPFSPIELAGDEEEIEALWREAIKLAPACPENRLGFARFLVDADHPVEATLHARRARDLLRDPSANAHLDPRERLALEREVKALLATLNAR